VGLFIIDGDTSSPGLPGVALYLSIELSVGAPPAGGAGGVSAIDGIFRLEGEVVLVLNTTFRTQSFVIPDEFLRLMPADTAPAVVIGASIPGITGQLNERNDGIDNDGKNGIDDAGEGTAPEAYIVATIQGSITLFDSITLAGIISISAGSSGFVRITGAVSPDRSIYASTRTMTALPQPSIRPSLGAQPSPWLRAARYQACRWPVTSFWISSPSMAGWC
jgi:hypothetical protein